MTMLDNQLDAEVTAIELHELEVIDPVVAEVETAARDGQVGDPAPARALYRRFGVDPTRHRPSSEALLRRVRKGDGLPRLNSLVDVANLLSLRLQVPVGLYDLDRVQGGLTLRLGGPGEGYAGIGKEHVNVEGRICVADEAGACGNPSSDSARTMITTSTGRALWLFFLPVADAELAATYELVARYGRGLLRVA